MHQRHYYTREMRWITVECLQCPAYKRICCSYIIVLLLSITSTTPHNENTMVTFLLQDASSSNLEIFQARSLSVTKCIHKYGKHELYIERFLIYVLQTSRRDDTSASSTDLRKMTRHYKLKKKFLQRNKLFCSVTSTEEPRRKISRYRKLRKDLHIAQQVIQLNTFAIRCIGFENCYDLINERKARINDFMFYAGQLTQKIAYLDKITETVTFPKKIVHLKLLQSSIKLDPDYYFKKESNAVQNDIRTLFGPYHSQACKEVFSRACKKCQGLFKTEISNLPLILKRECKYLYISDCRGPHQRLQLVCESKRFPRTQVPTANCLCYHMLLLTTCNFDGDSLSHKILIYKLPKQSNRNMRKPTKERGLDLCRSTWLRINNTIPFKRISQLYYAIIGLISDEKLIKIYGNLNFNTMWLLNNILDKRVHSLYNCMHSLNHILVYVKIRGQPNVLKVEKYLYAFPMCSQYNRFGCVKCTVMKCHVGCATLNLLIDLLSLNIQTSAIFRVNGESEIRGNIMPAARQVFITVYFAHKCGLKMVYWSHRLRGQIPVVLTHDAKIKTLVKRYNLATFRIKLIEDNITCHGYIPLKLYIHTPKHADLLKQIDGFVKDILKGDAKKNYFSRMNLKWLKRPDYSIIKHIHIFPKLFVIKSYRQAKFGKIDKKNANVMVGGSSNIYHTKFVLKDEWWKTFPQERFQSDKKRVNIFNVLPTKLILISRKCVLLAFGFWSSRFSPELTALVNVNKEHWLGENVFLDLLTSVHQHCDQYNEKTRCEFKIVNRSKTKRKYTWRLLSGLQETEGSRIDSDKIRQYSVNILRLILEKSTSLKHSGQYKRNQNNIFLTKINSLFNKFIIYTRQRHNEHGGTGYKRSRFENTHESSYTSNTVDKVFKEQNKNAGNRLRVVASTRTSDYSFTTDNTINSTALRSSERYLNKNENISHNLVNRQDDGTFAHNDQMRLAQTSPYFSNHEKDVIKVVLAASNILQAWQRLTEAEREGKQGPKPLKTHNSMNGFYEHLNTFRKYILKCAKRLSENNTLNIQSYKQVLGMLKKRRKRQSYLDNDSLIRTDLMTDLRSKWLDMKEDLNKLQEKIYDAKERITNVEEDLHRLIRRGDMLAQADVKITNNDKLKRAMIQADWGLIQLEFRSLQKEILSLQKQTEKKEKYKFDKKENRELKIIKNAIEAKKSMFDKAVQNILNLNEQKIDETNGTKSMDSDNNNANDYSKFEDEDIANQLNALSGFSQGGRYYDPSLQRVDNILKTVLSRNKRATFQDELQRSSDAALLTVNNMEREGNDDVDMSNLLTLNNGHLTRHDTLTYKGVSTDSTNTSNVTFTFPFFESLEGNESLMFLYPKSIRKFVAEWAKLRKNTTKLLKIVIKMKKIYSHIQAGIRDLKRKGKSTEINIINIIKSNNSASRIYNSKLWKMVWKDIKTCQKEINKYNIQFEKYDIDRFIQNINEKIEIIQKKLDAEKSFIENRLHSGSNPHTLLPFSIGTGLLQENWPTEKIGSGDENSYMSNSDTGKDTSSDKMLKKLENLIVDAKIASSSQNLTNVESTLNMLLIKHAAENGISFNQLGNVNSRQRRALRIKRRGRRRNKKKKRRRRKHSRYSGYLGDSTSGDTIDDIENPYFLYSALRKANYNVDDNVERPLEQISISSLYNEDFLGEQASQQIFDNSDWHSVQTVLPSNGFTKSVPGDSVEYLMPISESTSDDENYPPNTDAAPSNVSTANYYSYSRGLEQKNKEDNLISSKMKDLLNEIDSSNIAESLQDGTDVVSKRETKSKFLSLIDQIDENNRAKSDLYQNSKTFRHELQRGTYSQDKDRDIGSSLQEVAENSQESESDNDFPSLTDIINHNKIKAFDHDLSLSTTIMNSRDSNHGDTTSADILDKINVDNNLDFKKQQRQRNEDTATEIKDIKNAQKLVTETIKDFQTYQDRLMAKHLKENSEVLKELKQAINDHEKKDTKMNSLKGSGKKVKH